MVISHHPACISLHVCLSFARLNALDRICTLENSRRSFDEAKRIREVEAADDGKKQTIELAW